MPELPEVETLRLGLEPRLAGQTIKSTIFGDFPGVIGEQSIEQFNAMIVGRTFSRLRRRGKYLIVELDEDVSLIIHLRMTGVLIVSPHDAPPERHQHLTFTLDNGTELRFADQRKFGRVVLADAEKIAALEARLGPEPLSDDFTVKKLGEVLARRKAPIKSALLNQELIAGLGNIYVDEALFGAGVHPQRTAESLTPEELERLHRSIRKVLQNGLTHRGTSFSHFKDSYGEAGDNQHHLLIYGRGNTQRFCPNCGGPISKITVGGRGTHFCPICQV
jgi:formamidopyrimidine-DNA glycosylase